MKVWRLPAEALGAGTTLSAPLLYPLIDPHHELVFHLHAPPGSLFGGVLLDWAAIILLTGALLLAAELLGPRARLLLRWVLLLLFPPVLYFGCHSQGWTPTLPLGVLLLYVAAGTVALSALLRLRTRWTAAEELARSVLLFAGLSALVFAAQFIYAWRGANNVTKQAAVTAERVSLSAAPRGGPIVWIVLDELSFEQVFERRAPGLALPNFDRLAAEAANFSHVVAAGESTETALPSLLTGIPVGELDRTADGNLLALRDRGSNRWSRFDEHRTVFEDADRSGYRTAVDGWYMPYCRMLPHVLTSCMGSFRLARVLSMRPDLSAAQNALQLPRSLLQDTRRLLTRSHPGNAELNSHIEDYVALREAALHSLSDPRQNFLLLHLPVPHPLAIYDRHTGELESSHGSYLDNLALADRVLGEMRTALENRGAWDDATVLVMGDHGWRVSTLWMHSQRWTSEDAQASDGGRFDPRPAYLVKLPGQHVGSVVPCSFPAERTRDLLDARMQGMLTTPEELQAWACGSVARRNAKLMRPDRP